MNNNNLDRPLVSIIIPVYNVEQFLRQCIDSIINQTLQNIEIIIVDDGSKDNSPVICDSYAEKDKRVRVIHQQNSGYGKAVNTGFDNARGEYLGIIESDDYVELNMFERLYTTAKAYNLDAVRCHFYFYHSHINEHVPVVYESIPKNIMFSPREKERTFLINPSVWAMLYNTEFIRKNEIKFLETPGASYQDVAFTFKVYSCAKQFMVIDDLLVHYRFDNENSSVKSKSKVFCICDEYAEIERFSKENNMYKDIKFIILEMKIIAYLWNYNRLDKPNNLHFLKTFSREMRMHIIKREIKYNVFSFKEIINLYVIAFLYLLYPLFQNRGNFLHKLRIIKRDVRQKIKNHRWYKTIKKIIHRRNKNGNP